MKGGLAGGRGEVGGRASRGRGPVSPPLGPLVAIETSGAVGSVALAAGGAVVAMRTLGRPRRHADGLIRAVGEVLAEAETRVDAVAGVVVGAGPGSFTGVRIAGAAAKALASSLDVPLYAQSSLHAAAVAGDAPVEGAGPELRYVLFDARRGRVYGACYNASAAGVEQVTGPHGGTILDVLNARPPVDTIFMGDGAVAHAALLGAAGFAVRPPPAGVPAADALLACRDWVPVDVAAWEPLYVREWKPG